MTDNDMSQWAQDGPLHPAWAWVKAVLFDHDLLKAWPLITSDYRAELVDGWLSANHDHPAIDREGAMARDVLTGDEPANHLLWQGFAVTSTREFSASCSHLRLEHCGLASEPRPLAPDLEMVLLVDSGTPAPAAGVELPAVGLLMAHRPESRWLLQALTHDMGAA